LAPRNVPMLFDYAWSNWSFGESKFSRSPRNPHVF
jgi:hypothetical protein